MTVLPEELVLTVYPSRNWRFFHLRGRRVRLSSEGIRVFRDGIEREHPWREVRDVRIRRRKADCADFLEMEIRLADDRIALSIEPSKPTLTRNWRGPPPEAINACFQRHCPSSRIRDYALEGTARSVDEIDDRLDALDHRLKTRLKGAPCVFSFGVLLVLLAWPLLPGAFAKETMAWGIGWAGLAIGLTAWLWHQYRKQRWQSERLRVEMSNVSGAPSLQFIKEGAGRAVRTRISHDAQNHIRRVFARPAAVLGYVFVLGLFGLELWWTAPIDIPRPGPRVYPPNNAYAVYMKLAEQTREIEAKDQRLKEALQWKFPKSSPEPTEGMVKYVLERLAPIRREYRRHLREPSVAIFNSCLSGTHEELSIFHEWGRAERMDLQQALKNGETDQALDDYETVLRLSEQIRNEGMIPHHLTASGMQGGIQHALVERLERLNSTTCNKLVQITRDWAGYRQPFWRAIDQESANCIAECHNWYETGLPLSNVDASMLKVMNLRWAARDAMEYFIRLRAEVQKPENLQREVAGPTYFFNKIFISWSYKMSASPASTEARLRMTGCAAGVRAYRLRKGKYPVSLEQAGVADLDKDPFTGGSFVYRPEKKRFLIYSVGMDGKDDGGQRIADRGDLGKGKGDLSVVPFRPDPGVTSTNVVLGAPAWLK